MKANESGRQTLERQNFWQQVKYVKLYSNLFQALMRETVLGLDSQQRGPLIFYIRNIPPQGALEQLYRKDAMNFQRNMKLSFRGTGVGGGGGRGGAVFSRFKMDGAVRLYLSFGRWMRGQVKIRHRPRFVGSSKSGQPGMKLIERSGRLIMGGQACSR